VTDVVLHCRSVFLIEQCLPIVTKSEVTEWDASELSPSNSTDTTSSLAGRRCHVFGRCARVNVSIDFLLENEQNDRLNASTIGSSFPARTQRSEIGDSDTNVTATAAGSHTSEHVRQTTSPTLDDNEHAIDPASVPSQTFVEDTNSTGNVRTDHTGRSRYTCQQQSHERMHINERTRAAGTSDKRDDRRKAMFDDIDRERQCVEIVQHISLTPMRMRRSGTDATGRNIGGCADVPPDGQVQWLPFVLDVINDDGPMFGLHKSLIIDVTTDVTVDTVETNEHWSTLPLDTKTSADETTENGISVDVSTSWTSRASEKRADSESSTSVHRDSVDIETSTYVDTSAHPTISSTVSVPVDCVSIKMCPFDSCTFARELDHRGCPTCNCLPPVNTSHVTCPALSCPACLYGHHTDSNGVDRLFCSTSSITRHVHLRFSVSHLSMSTTSVSTVGRTLSTIEL
jgi:hypothetical protein